MRLVTIGSGNIGKSIGAWAVKVGYDVTFTSRDLRRAEQAATSAGKGAKAALLKDALPSADIVLLAVPYNAASETVKGVREFLRGKLVIDATNPISSGSLVVGFTTSAAEEIAKTIPGAKVVKAFNTVFSKVLASQNPKIKDHPVSIFYAGDDKDAKAKTAELISKMGFDAVDCGALTAARTLEPLALLMVSLGYGMGLGQSIGYTLLR